MPLLQTSGNVTADAYGGGVAAVPNYIEDVFSTYLYTGNDSTQTITNGIDLSTKGGMVWIKPRDLAEFHSLFDTSRGAGYYLSSSQSSAQSYGATTLTSFNSNGFSLGGATRVNADPYNIASWTFRKQPKFFDVVTWTGNGAATQTISHNLGSVPGCIIAKVTSTTGNWFVYHRATSGTPLQDYLRLNLTNAANASGSDLWGATSTTITVDSGLNLTTNGATYVAYLFAHNAGGFGLTGTDNVISCGSWYNSGSAPVNVDLGYEPQWILIKNADSAQNWFLMDTMRGDSLTSQAILKPNTSDAETVSAGPPGYPVPTATGFTTYLGASGTFIYIAIRRGPMKVPTSGTSVFAPVTSSATGSVLTTNFPVDMALAGSRTAVERGTVDRLRGIPTASNGVSPWLVTQTTAAETNYASNPSYYNANNTSIQTGVYLGAIPEANYLFGRAPSFFDEVCYTGTGASQDLNHNLSAVPELIIVKRRNSAYAGRVYSATIGNTKTLVLFSASGNSEAITDTGVEWDAKTPTSSVFSVGAAAATNNSGSTYVAYLFATCPGVSKVGSYTGTGATQTISCGFTGGARFVLVKRTDSTGDWYVWDTARGMVSGTDPSLLLNSTAAEVNADSIYTTTGGFQIVSTAAGINASGGSYIFLAIS